MRERLKRLVLDRDNAAQNSSKAYKAQFTPGINLQQTAAKADLLKEELDQATSRMEQCKVRQAVRFLVAEKITTT